MEPDEHDVLLRRIARIADRLRTMDVGRLARPGDDGVSPAEATHAACVRLAAAGGPLRPAPDPVPPRLADHGAGDQWQVIASESARLADGASVSSGAVASDAAEAGATLRMLIDAEVQDLRRRL